MASRNQDVIRQFAQASAIDAAAVDSACKALAAKYIHIFDSVIPWRDAVERAESRYPGRSRGWIAQHWLALDREGRLGVVYDPVYDLAITELN